MLEGLGKSIIKPLIIDRTGFSFLSCMGGPPGIELGGPGRGGGQPAPAGVGRATPGLLVLGGAAGLEEDVLFLGSGSYPLCQGSPPHFLG